MSDDSTPEEMVKQALMGLGALGGAMGTTTAVAGAGITGAELLGAGTVAEIAPVGVALTAAFVGGLLIGDVINDATGASDWISDNWYDALHNEHGDQYKGMDGIDHVLVHDPELDGIDYVAVPTEE